MKQETAGLLKKADESIRAAELQLERGFSDFAAARAYYALFYVAEALLFEEGVKFSKHSAVHAAFGQRFAKTGRMDPKFHRYLLEAFDQRLLADYETAEHVSDESARTIAERAREFLDAARKFIRD